MALKLPFPFPNETLYGIAARAHVLAGNRHPRQTSVDLFGNSRALFRHDIPSGLAEFASRTEGWLGDPTEIIDAHTAIPYFTRFKSAGRARKAAALALNSRGPKLKLVLGMQASRIGAFLPLSACPRCAAEDAHDRGVPYWRLAHQLPGAVVCAEHMEPLWRAPRLVSWRRLRVCSLPFDGGVPLTPSVEPRSRQELERLGSLARITSAIRDTPLPAGFDALVLRQTYLHALRDQGHLTRVGKVRITDFLAAVEHHFMAIREFGDFADYFDGERRIRGFLKLLRSGSLEPSPLAHALLIDFLWGTWEGFSQAYQWQSVMTAERESADGAHASRGRVLGPKRLARRAANRAKVEKLLNEQPDMTRPMATKILRWDLSWLAIWDKPWLDERLPPTPRDRFMPRHEKDARVDWHARDVALLRRVEHGADRLTFGSNQVITRLTIVDNLGGLPFNPQWGKLPLSTAALDYAVERLRRRRSAERK